MLVLFGKYYGSLKQEGFYWVNPFCTAVNPTVSPTTVTPSGSVSFGGSRKLPQGADP